MKTLLSLIALLAIVLFVAPSFASGLISPAVQMGAFSTEAQSITYESYNITVPPVPQVTASAGYEFHLGILSNNNATFIKSTISYGCQIGEFKACFPPFLNRYIFYVSIIDQATGSRVQYPSSGYTLTVGSTYKIVGVQTAHCVLIKQPSWTFTISNSTNTFSVKACANDQPTYNGVAAGLLEIHNVTACDEFSTANSVTQNNITVLNSASHKLPLSWSTYYNPSINCSFSLSFANSNTTVEEHWIS